MTPFRSAWIFTLVFLSVPALVHAQTPPAVTGTSTVAFTSADHTTTIPAGQTNAGQPTLSGYQFSLFAAAADVTSGVPIAVGVVVPKATVTAVSGTTPQQYSLTFTQMGFTGANAIPACTTLPCPQYSLLGISIGPNGTSVKAVASESNPFTAVLPIQGAPPAGPLSLTVKP